MATLKGRTPDYKLKMMDKRTGVKSRKMGAAWINESGSITINLDPFVSIPASADIVLTLFPWNWKDEKENEN